MKQMLFITFDKTGLKDALKSHETASCEEDKSYSKENDLSIHHNSKCDTIYYIVLAACFIGLVADVGYLSYENLRH